MADFLKIILYAVLFMLALPFFFLACTFFIALIVALFEAGAWWMLISLAAIFILVFVD